MLCASIIASSTIAGSMPFLLFNNKQCTKAHFFLLSFQVIHIALLLLLYGLLEREERWNIFSKVEKSKATMIEQAMKSYHH